MNRVKGQQGQRGTSTLELIVVLPTLLLVFFAIMELSRAWLTVNITTTAAREGARVASVTDPFSPALAEMRINEILTAANITPEVINVTCSTDPCATDSQVTANVQVMFDTVMPIFLPMLIGLDIDRTTIMRYE